MQPSTDEKIAPANPARGSGSIAAIFDNYDIWMHIIAKLDIDSTVRLSVVCKALNKIIEVNRNSVKPYTTTFREEEADYYFGSPSWENVEQYVSKFPKLQLYYDGGFLSNELLNYVPNIYSYESFDDEVAILFPLFPNAEIMSFTDCRINPGTIFPSSHEEIAKLNLPIDISEYDANIFEKVLEWRNYNKLCKLEITDCKRVIDCSLLQNIPELELAECTRLIRTETLGKQRKLSLFEVEIPDVSQLAQVPMLVLKDLNRKSKVKLSVAGFQNKVLKIYGEFNRTIAGGVFAISSFIIDFDKLGAVNELYLNSIDLLMTDSKLTEEQKERGVDLSLFYGIPYLHINSCANIKSLVGLGGHRKLHLTDLPNKFSHSFNNIDKLILYNTYLHDYISAITSCGYIHVANANILTVIERDCFSLYEALTSPESPHNKSYLEALPSIPENIYSANLEAIIYAGNVCMQAQGPTEVRRLFKFPGSVSIEPFGRGRPSSTFVKLCKKNNKCCSYYHTRYVLPGTVLPVHHALS